jgi:hypothetical protein
MSTNQSTLETLGATRTIDQIRKDGIDKQMLENAGAKRETAWTVRNFKAGQGDKNLLV